MISKDYFSRIESLVSKVEDVSCMSLTPLVSVVLVTFNHEKYIRETLEGILMQQVNFDYEIIIGDDCSTDGNLSIITAYQKKFPDKIRLRLAITNLMSIGLKNSLGVLNACRGKYIALCEGDDYWTDPYKLQKQVDFLRDNKNYSICGHYTKYVNHAGNDLHLELIGRRVSTFSINDALLKSPLHISSFMFRNCCMDKIIKVLIESKLPAGDNVLMLLLLENGKGYCIPETMSYYRLNEGGIWTSKSFIEKYFGTLLYVYSTIKITNSVNRLDWLLAIGLASSNFIITVGSSIYRENVSSLNNDILTVLKNQQILSRFSMFCVLLYGVIFIPYSIVLKLFKKFKNY